MQKITPPPHTLESIKHPITQAPLTLKQHTNSLATHFANQSHKPTHPLNRKIIKNLKKIKTNQDQSSEITLTDTKNALKSIKNSLDTGPDNISNIHIKHLGDTTLTFLTNIFNKSIKLNFIPHNWKKKQL